MPNRMETDNVAMFGPTSIVSGEHVFQQQQQRRIADKVVIYMSAS